MRIGHCKKIEREKMRVGLQISIFKPDSGSFHSALIENVVEKRS